MGFAEIYRRQAALLVRVLPFIAEEDCFALKGGTAINLFVRDMPDAREMLIAGIMGKMPDDHKQFLISFERSQPDWKLLGLSGVAELPAVKWRQQNLDKLSKDKRAALVANLEKVLLLLLRHTQASSFRGVMISVHRDHGEP